MSTGNYVIPKTMKAAVVRHTGAPLEVVNDWPVPQPETLKPGECLLKMECTGVCHTDLHAARGDWPIPAKTPLIGGHEVSSRFLLCAMTVATVTVPDAKKLSRRV